MPSRYLTLAGKPVIVVGLVCRQRQACTCYRDYCEGLRDSLDLVVIGAWYGQGRKVKWYSPFLLAAYDPETDEYQSVCRCMSGFTDAFYAEVCCSLSVLCCPQDAAASVLPLECCGTCAAVGAVATVLPQNAVTTVLHFTSCCNRAALRMLLQLCCLGMHPSCYGEHINTHLSQRTK